MAGQKYNKAYEAYQQVVYRDGHNPTFWCSIGVLYFQISQYHYAMAYSHAIESIHTYRGDAIDAYAQAAELDPGNTAITQRLHLLKHSQATGTATCCSSFTGCSSYCLCGEVSHHPPHIIGAETSPTSFRGGPPPAVVIDESRYAPSHTNWHQWMSIIFLMAGIHPIFTLLPLEILGNFPLVRILTHAKWRDCYWPPNDREAGWDRHNWEWGRDSSQRRGAPAYLHGPSPPVLTPRVWSPSQTSLIAYPSRTYWESRLAQPPQIQLRSPRSPPPDLGAIRSASDDHNNPWQNTVPVELLPESARVSRVAHPAFMGSAHGSESPCLAAQRITSPGQEAPKRDRKCRTNVKQRNEHGQTEIPKPFISPPNQNPSFKVNYAKWLGLPAQSAPGHRADLHSQSRQALIPSYCNLLSYLLAPSPPGHEPERMSMTDTVAVNISSDTGHTSGKAAVTPGNHPSSSVLGLGVCWGRYYLNPSESESYPQKAVLLELLTNHDVDVQGRDGSLSGRRGQKKKQKELEQQAKVDQIAMLEKTLEDEPDLTPHPNSKWKLCRSKAYLEIPVYDDSKGSKEEGEDADQDFKPASNMPKRKKANKEPVRAAIKAVRSSWHELQCCNLTKVCGSSMRGCKGGVSAFFAPGESTGRQTNPGSVRSLPPLAHGSMASESTLVNNTVVTMSDQSLDGIPDEDEIKAGTGCCNSKSPQGKKMCYQCGEVEDPPQQIVTMSRKKSTKKFWNEDLPSGCQD
ncbi:hypothetical protein BJV78DRAFT_1308905 [Lactifluus subvellereus]|nr:hypothetical protein BJV78DRAFT_1308905 [Lactifluus subvellereus]